MAVLAPIMTLAPSRAARNAIASPIPRDAPDTNSVLPFKDLVPVVLASTAYTSSSATHMIEKCENQWGLQRIRGDVPEGTSFFSYLALPCTGLVASAFWSLASRAGLI